MFFLGYDIGSSSIKAALLRTDDGKCVAVATAPQKEMPILTPQPDHAEQDPDSWWQELVHATRQLRQQFNFHPENVKGIGIAYQMHGLVCVDKNNEVLRPAIIWCDSRAVEIGDQATAALGMDYCLQHMLNAPGNFTASKLKWVKENEPHIYERIHRVMLPGDYIAMRLTGEVRTTVSGLSEGICWDFSTGTKATRLLEYYGIPEDIWAPVVPAFGIQGLLTEEAATELRISPGTPVTYRAGDQPNNAFSLQVLHPGEAAATAGTSGVVYAVHDQHTTDPLSRVNTFVHVNNDPSGRHIRNGVLMCVNGTGSMNAWIKKLLGSISYDEMNRLAATAPAGAAGLQLFPFGNGAERVLQNRRIGASIANLQLNIHDRSHLLRAAQEGIVFALYYGMNIMREMGLDIQRIRAGEANMFLSPVFRQIFANTAGVEIALYNTDGAQGAARGAAVGAGYYQLSDAFHGMRCLTTISPDNTLHQLYTEIYHNWLHTLQAGL